MLDFVRGNPKKPCGNLLLYAHTQGRNSITSDAKFIVCNVFVSFVSASEDHFPVVAFPPTIIEREEQLSMFLGLNPECDIIRLEDFDPPLHQEAKHYVRTRIKNFNLVVGQYVEMCRDYFHLRVKESHADEFSLLNYKILSKSPGTPGILEESSYIDQLEQYVKVYETAPHKIHIYFHKIIKTMEDKYPYYDLANFTRVIGLDAKIDITGKKSWEEEGASEKYNPQLATLYLRKFRAIQEEKYEEAAKIQNHIRTMEREAYALDTQSSEIEKHN